jgi:hypothetical protein
MGRGGHAAEARQVGHRLDGSRVEQALEPVRQGDELRD